MLAKTHITTGILFGLVFMPFVNMGSKVVFFILVVLGSLLPDIDTPYSKLGSKIKPISWLIRNVLGHRGLLHSLVFAVLVHALIWVFVGEIYSVALFIGYFSHLVIDGFTKEGVGLLHPFHGLRMRGFIETGSFGESMFNITILVLILLRIKFLFL